MAQSSKIEILNSVSLDKLLSRHNPFQEPDCKVDLSGITLITPGALASLAAACHALAGDRRKPVMIVHDQSVRKYLLRSGFIGAVEAVTSFEPRFPHISAPGYSALRGSNPLLLEVTRIASGAALPELLNQIVWVLRNRLRYRKYDAFDIATAISEICQNTFDHNQHTCGFIAMQVYGSGTNRFVEIGVADYGVGLTATLRRNPKNPPVISDYAAIRVAIQLGTSEYDDPTRGTGLHHLLEIAYKHEGSVQFRSGSATMRFRMDKRQGWGFRVVRMPGVQITLTLRSKAHA